MTHSKRKGDAGEREVVEIFRAHDIPAQRVPLSGAAGGLFAEDVHFRLPGTRETWRGEVKRRKNGFKQDYQWLGDADVLFKRADAQHTGGEKKWLVTMRLEDWILLVKDNAPKEN